MSDEENGCLRCLNCLARVPCATLAAWVTMAMSTGACVGGLLIAREKTKKMLDDADWMQLLPTICICVVFGMIFIGTLFLLVSVISSGRTSKQVFSSSRKNICGRVLNVFVVMVMVVIQVAWIVLTTILSIPVFLIGILYYQTQVRDINCFNLKHYTLYDDKKFCGEDLRQLYNKSHDAFICYAVAYVAAILVCVSMSYFMICAGSNVVWLRESRFVTYNAYGNDARGRDSMHVVDTKM